MEQDQTSAARCLDSLEIGRAEQTQDKKSTSIRWALHHGTPGKWASDGNMSEPRMQKLSPLCINHATNASCAFSTGGGGCENKCYPSPASVSDLKKGVTQLYKQPLAGAFHYSKDAGEPFSEFSPALSGGVLSFLI